MSKCRYKSHLLKEAKLYLKGYALYKEAIAIMEKNSSQMELEKNTKYQLLKEKKQMVDESFAIAVSDDFKEKVWNHFFYGSPVELYEEARYKKELDFWISTLIVMAEMDIFEK